MKSFARKEIAVRLERVQAELTRTHADPAEEHIHALRVSLRRLFAALRAFDGLFPARRAARLRDELRPVLKLAGEVRNYDIAASLAREAGIGKRTALWTGLARERKSAAGKLVAKVTALTTIETAHDLEA